MEKADSVLEVQAEEIKRIQEENKKLRELLQLVAKDVGVNYKCYICKGQLACSYMRRPQCGLDYRFFDWRYLDELDALLIEVGK